MTQPVTTPTPKEERKRGKWYFTFGSGQKHNGKYFVIVGISENARRKMFERFGPKWSMQYSEEQWNNPGEDSIRFQGLDPKSKPTMADVWGWEELK